MDEDARTARAAFPVYPAQRVVHRSEQWLQTSRKHGRKRRASVLQIGEQRNNIRRGIASGAQRSDNRTCGCAAINFRLDTVFFQGLQNAEVRHSLCAAASQCNADLIRTAEFVRRSPQEHMRPRCPRHFRAVPLQWRAGSCQTRQTGARPHTCGQAAGDILPDRTLLRR